MSYTLMDLAAAANHLHMQPNELKHFAQRGELECVKRGDDTFLFEHRALDEWAQRRMLDLPAKQLATEHRAAMRERRSAYGDDFRIASLIPDDSFTLPFLSAKTKAGVIRDMTDLAESTSLVYDPELLFAELTAREEAASTAVGGGAAFLHPRFHDPYLFAESFLCIGRSLRPIFFGADEGASTDIFFLVCCTDHRLHLHVLARLCLLAHATNLLEQIRLAPDASYLRSALSSAESDFLSSSH